MSDLISKQAAIQAIDDLPNCYNGYSDTYDKAYIIGVLEELPSIDAVEVTRCRDCKSALVDRLSEEAKKLATGFAKAAIIANNMPTIEPKKGKWIDLRSDGRFGKETRCSQCGEIYWEWMNKFDYCPNCGAKMERSKE